MTTTEYFSDCTYSEVPNPTVTFRCGMTVYIESLLNGQYIGRQWNSQGMVPYPDLDLNVHDTPQAFWLEIDGQLLHSHWEWMGMSQEQDGDKLRVAITLKHSVRPVEVKVHTLLDGSGIICRWLDITNIGSQDAALSRVFPWSGVLYAGRQVYAWQTQTDENQLYSVGYMQGTRWGNEGVFQWVHLPRAGYRVAGKYTREAHRHPMFMLRNELTGHHFIGQLAWSGSYSFDFDVSGDFTNPPGECLLSFKVGPDAPAPLRIIAPGETITTPEVSMGIVSEGFDEAVQAMHDHIRKSYIKPQARDRGCWIEVGIGPEFEITPELTHHAIDVASQVGAEIFWIDAGWYNAAKADWGNTVGDWNVGSRFPNGIAEFRDHIHEKGMLWGLWMECERLGVESQMYKDHPDWPLISYNGDSIHILDLTRPEIATWMEDQICRVIDENQVDFFRLDHNAGNRAGGFNTESGFVENTYWRYYEAFYGIFDRVRAKYPNMVMENCGGGGGRTDLGIMKRFNHTWVTDVQCAPQSFGIGNGMTIALPPELVDRHVTGVGQQTYTAGDFDFQARLSLFGKPTIGAGSWLPGSIPNPVMLKKTRHIVDLYKNFVRDFMPASRFYHHTPTLNGYKPDGIGIMEMVSADRTKAIAGVFRLLGQESDCVLRFKGLDVSKQYEVTSENSGTSFIRNGDALVFDGLPIHLGTVLTSELIICKEV